VGRDGLPVQIRTADPEAAVVKTATFSKVQKNIKLPDSAFQLPTPGADWDVQVELLKKPGETGNNS
jgi:outer membrane lipoprotein-sorting protein